MGVAESLPRADNATPNYCTESFTFFPYTFPRFSSCYHFSTPQDYSLIIHFCIFQESNVLLSGPDLLWTGPCSQGRRAIEALEARALLLQTVLWLWLIVYRTELTVSRTPDLRQSGMKVEYVTTRPPSPPVWTVWCFISWKAPEDRCY